MSRCSHSVLKDFINQCVFTADPILRRRGQTPWSGFKRPRPHRSSVVWGQGPYRVNTVHCGSLYTGKGDVCSLSHCGLTKVLPRSGSGLLCGDVVGSQTSARLQPRQVPYKVLPVCSTFLSLSLRFLIIRDS